jgi:outer membrane protein assembly factor BamD (BamD/ComL family)
MASLAERTFRRSRGGVLLAIALCALLLTGCSGWQSFRERTDTMRHTLFDDGWEDPQAEARMANGIELYNALDYDKAIKEFKKVADNKFNHTELAEHARFLQAECRYNLGEYPDAVDTYHRLLIDFPTGAHRRESCERMFKIADYWLEDFRREMELRAGEKGILYWKPSWPNPWDKTKPVIDQEGRALEAMENIHTQDITGPLADKALFLCGEVNFIRGNFSAADRFFSQLVEYHRESPLRSKALVYAIQAKNNATGGAIYDGRKCAEALQLIHVAEATLPEVTQDPETADKLTRAKFAIRSQQAEKDFRTAEYYERIGHPGSAVFYYELCRRRYAGTRYADIANERKEYLFALLNQGHPYVGNDPVAVAEAKWKEVIGKKPPIPESAVANQGDPNTSVVPAGGAPTGGVPTTVTPSGGIIPGSPAGNASPQNRP